MLKTQTRTGCVVPMRKQNTKQVSQKTQHSELKQLGDNELAVIAQCENLPLAEEKSCDCCPSSHVNEDIGRSSVTTDARNHQPSTARAAAQLARSAAQDKRSPRGRSDNAKRKVGNE